MTTTKRVIKEWFALLPVKTIHGWAWLSDVRAVHSMTVFFDGSVTHKNYIEKLWRPSAS